MFSPVLSPCFHFFSSFYSDSPAALAITDQSNHGNSLTIGAGSANYLFTIASPVSCMKRLSRTMDQKYSFKYIFINRYSEC